MSHSDEMPNLLSVKVDKTALIALQTGLTLDARHPVVGVWTNILDHDEHLATSRDLSQGVPAYEIYDVQLATDDETQTAVKLFFRRPGSETLDPVPVVDDYNYAFEMIVPVQDLAVVQALRMAPEACFFAVFDARHADPSVDHGVRLRDTLLVVILPAVETLESDEITEKMETLISQSFAAPFSPGSDDDDHDHSEVPISLRKAQAFLLSTLVGISLGDEVSLRRVIQMEEWFEQYYERATGRSEDTSNDDADQVAFVSAVIHLLRIVMMRSGMSPGATEETDNPEISPLGANDHDDEFMDIMKHLEIEQDLRRIGSETKREGTELIRFSSQAATIHKPFVDGWPDSMKALENHPVLAGRTPLWERDFSEETDDETEVEDSQFAEVMTSFALIAAARAARLAEVLKKNNEHEGDLHPTVPVVRWLTGDDDVYMWELVAMGPLVEDYETLQFADLLNFSTDPQEDPHHALYFTVTVHTLAHQFMAEEWTTKSFTEALEKLDVQFPDAKQVALHILDDLEQYSVEEEDDDDDAPCTAAKATHSLSTSGIPLSRLSKAVALLVPTMADVQASKNNLPVGDEEWKKFRKRYIKDLLAQVAATTSRNFTG